MENITIQQILTWGIPTVIAIVGATFALTKYSNAGALRALEDRLKFKNDKLQDLEKQARSQRDAGEDIAYAHAVFLPVQGVATQISDSETTALAKRIEDLEHERELLLSELSTKVIASLDPRSELSNLLSQLQSSDKAIRSKAIDGLIALKDPFSFQSLVSFFVDHPDEATSGDNPYISKWFSVFIATGGAEGAEFVVSQIESTNPRWSEAAFSTLQYALDSPELIDGAMPSLESAALRHFSATTRTKAKLLIQYLDTKKKEYEEREAEMRSLKQRLEQKGEANQQTEEEQDRDRIPSHFIILSALKESGLDCLARSILHSGQEIEFWRSGSMIAEEFVRNPDKQDNCVRAIEQLIDTSGGIAKPSYAFLLYLLGQMKTESGARSEGDAYFSAARQLSPSITEYLVQHERAFGVQNFAAR